jgi:hypothetical protein
MGSLCLITHGHGDMDYSRVFTPKIPKSKFENEILNRAFALP